MSWLMTEKITRLNESNAPTRNIMLCQDGDAWKATAIITTIKIGMLA